MQRQLFRILLIITSLTMVATPLKILHADNSQMNESIQQVLDEIAKKVPENSYRIKVKSPNEGILTISGLVASETVTTAIKNTALTVPGIEEVNVSVEIDGSLSSLSNNLELASKVEKAIKEELPKGNYTIGVSAINDAITLEGSVDKRELMQIILDIVENVEGVTTIENRLALATDLPDDTILFRITQKIKSNPRFDGATAKVTNGIVALSGTLNNHQDADVLLSSILMIPGVTQVKSTLSIDGKEYAQDILR